MKIRLLHVVSIFMPAAVLTAQVSLTGFGTGDFLVDGSSTLISSSQTASALTISVNDMTGSFAGTFNPVNMTDQAAALSLTATVAPTNPASNFWIQLYDGSETSSYVYSGNWSSFTTGASSTVPLSFSSSSGTFNLGTVQGFTLLFGGAGSTLNVTFDSLSAVPEPSTYAALAGLAGLVVAAWRRRLRRIS